MGSGLSKDRKFPCVCYSSSSREQDVRESNRLCKEQKQCFWLIQQLFKAAGCLPDKGSLHLEYGEKQGTATLIVRKSLDKKRKGPTRPI